MKRSIGNIGKISVQLSWEREEGNYSGTDYTSVMMLLTDFWILIFG